MEQAQMERLAGWVKNNEEALFDGLFTRCYQRQMFELSAILKNVPVEYPHEPIPVKDWLAGLTKEEIDGKLKGPICLRDENMFKDELARRLSA